MQIHTILYNTGSAIEEVPFDEVKINLGDYFMVKDDILSPEQGIVKIEHVPICMLACPDKQKLENLELGRVKG